MMSSASIAITAWTVRPIGDLLACPASLRERVVDCVVGEAPGTVHEALIAAGVIPHPDAVGGEDAQEWIGRTDWCYSAWCKVDARTLTARVIELVIERVDTLAEIRVNGVRVACVANEFVPLRVSIKSFLHAGLNHIDVRICGPVAAVERLERRLGPRPVNGDWTPFSFLRKSACNFGWDWGPRVATVGLGPARLEARNDGRISAVRPLVLSCTEAEAVLRVAVDVVRVSDEPWRCGVELRGPDGRVWQATIDGIDDGGTCDLCIRDPERWWPRGHGAQPLYELCVTLGNATSVVDTATRRVGLRSVELDTGASQNRFAITVNGRPIWCRGANWIPIDLFPYAAPSSQYGRWLDAVCDAELNMLRVWGGGIYEREALYEGCDERGILVWQDFAFACATYPEEFPYDELVDAEARHQIARLCAHPSIVLWCGGNEDILAWWSWGWRERLKPAQTWGRGFWLERLPRLVAELDPSRPYWPESPYSGSMDIHPNDPDHGDRHTWDVKLEGYRSIVPRFCSEFGHQSPPSLGTLRERLEEEDLSIGSAELARRQRAWGGDAFQYAPLLEERFPPLRTLDEWIYAAQLLQARAYDIALRWMRANAPSCMGALFWQWNDVWRGHSWSVLDVAGRPKPSYFAVKRACAAQTLAILPEANGLRVTLCFAAGECTSTDAEARVRLVRMQGTVERDEAVTLRREDEWRATVLLPRWCSEPLDRQSSLLVVDCGSMRAVHQFVHDREAAYPTPRFEMVLRERAIELVAASLLVDVCILPELAGAMRTRVLDGMMTLLPGERVVVGCDGDPIDAEVARASMRTANALGR